MIISSLSRSFKIWIWKTEVRPGMWVKEFFITFRAYKPSSEPTRTIWNEDTNHKSKFERKWQTRRMTSWFTHPCTWSVRGRVQFMSKRSSPSSFSRELPKSFYKHRKSRERKRERDEAGEGLRLRRFPVPLGQIKANPASQKAFTNSETMKASTRRKPITNICYSPVRQGIV